ncbi:MAG TPA: SpoIID/LytB domain-containing protein [Solirubrobacteraceae bacterium]|nr:SpoIID/LytB domain-containing protein [Solirubrobacteraceae bacterium]
MRGIAGTGRRITFGVLVAVALAAAPAGAATSASGLYVVGAGNGHGVGMSQYGAAGYALHGARYEEILRDYYAGTTLGHIDPQRIVTVLLQSGAPAVLVTGATTIPGARTVRGAKLKLDPLWHYRITAAGDGLRVSLGRRPIGRFPAPLRMSGPGPLTAGGLGAFRGDLVFRPTPGGGVMTVNALGLDDYVRGVVSAEMPSSWPTQALEAQAVASRTYALTTRPAGPDFDLYATPTSQLYEGVRGETPAGDAAVTATSGQVVEYAGAPVQTLFFSSSGGATESAQNVFSLSPAAWLVGRPDPYDDVLGNPYHRWERSFSLDQAQQRLGRLVDGSLVGIEVLEHGVSPRIVRARVVGTTGSVAVSGDQLRQLFGTPSTWMSFTTVTSRGVITHRPGGGTTTGSGTTPEPTRSSSGGGGLAGGTGQAASQRGAAGHRGPAGEAVSGTIFPGPAGARVTVERLGARGWAPAAAGRLTAGGHYVVPVRAAGEYRVRYGVVDGPAITVG